ncbi:PREDICTED: ADP-ribosylation factor-related protein 1 [Gekko japonicus]|uniref:ADP-ribosylation factor-related protein 1 n=1 Tax=Gekko japonicus TaxID=146911 RepID=A0ABM1K1X5_GEKJA|nr:PREDICTED: ADP-ribosylation factor-related protein 1 [Gekko japonicus]
MYTLLSGLYKYMFQRDEYCILILGLDNAGKTTFLEQTKTRFTRNYKGMNFSKITTTVGLNIGTIDVGKARLMFWDLGGQEELQSLWDKYYAESHGIIYIIDSTDEERLSESKWAFEKMITSEVLEGVPLLVLAEQTGRRGLPFNPGHQDGIQRLHQQDWEEGLPDASLLGSHWQRGERGNRVDGEMRGEKHPSPSEEEGHHVEDRGGTEFWTPFVRNSIASL